LAFIYLPRLFEIYKLDSKNVLKKLNLVLEGKLSNEEFLKTYNVSLTDKDTQKSFIGMCDLYETKILSRYSKDECHSERGNIPLSVSFKKSY